jgi:hypothetical protein
MSQTGRIDYHIIVLTIGFLFIVLLAGCAQKVQLKSFGAECAPSDLEVTANNQTLFLKWDTNCPKDKLLSGYYIYLQPKSIADYRNQPPPRGVKPLNHDPYPGDTDPEDGWETMRIEHLDNGVEYYVTVRAVYPDKTVSIASNEVAAMPRPEGEFVLAYRYAALNDGFSFADGESVRADGELNDLYFYHKDGIDYIASPNRLNGFLRKSQFYSLGKTKSIYQYPELKLDIPPVEKIPALVGESYLIKTADGNFAKIRIEQATGENKERVLKIKYIYQTNKNQMSF